MLFVRISECKSGGALERRSVAMRMVEDLGLMRGELGWRLQPALETGIKAAEAATLAYHCNKAI